MSLYEETDTEREGDVKTQGAHLGTTEAETGGMGPPAEDCRPLGKLRERHGTDSPLEPPEGPTP